MEQITGRHNPLLTRLRGLIARREDRRAQGRYVLDGVKLLDEALRSRAPLETVICTPDVTLPPLPDGVRAVQVSRDVMQSVSPMRAPQGVLMICAMPSAVPPEKLTGRRYLVLDGLQDPGNVGTIWRAADALGADGLLLTGACADPWNPKTVRAAMGASFRLPVWEAGTDALTALLEHSELPLYATALQSDTVDVRRATLDRCAVVIGSEGSGVSDALLRASRATLKIPMRARCESLNAASAAAVVLWEMARGEGV